MELIGLNEELLLNVQASLGKHGFYDEFQKI